MKSSHRFRPLRSSLAFAGTFLSLAGVCPARSPLVLVYDRGLDARGMTVPTAGRKGVTYSYRVRAFNANGNSAYSSTASGLPR